MTIVILVIGLLLLGYYTIQRLSGYDHTSAFVGTVFASVWLILISIIVFLLVGFLL